MEKQNRFFSFVIKHLKNRAVSPGNVARRPDHDQSNRNALLYRTGSEPCRKLQNFNSKTRQINKHTYVVACVQITPPLRRRRALTTRRTATNEPSIESLHHLDSDFRFVDGVRCAVCRRESQKHRGPPPFRASKIVVNARNTPRDDAKRSKMIRKHRFASIRDDSRGATNIGDRTQRITHKHVPYPSR